MEDSAAVAKADGKPRVLVPLRRGDSTASGSVATRGRPPPDSSATAGFPERLEVTCGTKRGFYYPKERFVVCMCDECLALASEVRMTGGKWEKHAERDHARNWRVSIRVNDHRYPKTVLKTWLDEHRKVSDGSNGHGRRSSKRSDLDLGASAAWTRAAPVALEGGVGGRGARGADGEGAGSKGAATASGVISVSSNSGGDGGSTSHARGKASSPDASDSVDRGTVDTVAEARERGDGGTEGGGYLGSAAADPDAGPARADPAASRPRAPTPAVNPSGESGAVGPGGAAPGELEAPRRAAEGGPPPGARAGHGFGGAEAPLSAFRALPRASPSPSNALPPPDPAHVTYNSVPRAFLRARLPADDEGASSMLLTQGSGTALAFAGAHDPSVEPALPWAPPASSGLAGRAAPPAELGLVVPSAPSSAEPEALAEAARRAATADGVGRPVAAAQRPTRLALASRRAADSSGADTTPRSASPAGDAVAARARALAGPPEPRRRSRKPSAAHRSAPDELADGSEAREPTPPAERGIGAVATRARRARKAPAWTADQVDPDAASENALNRRAASSDEDEGATASPGTKRRRASADEATSALERLASAGEVLGGGWAPTDAAEIFGRSPAARVLTGSVHRGRPGSAAAEHGHAGLAIAGLGRTAPGEGGAAGRDRRNPEGGGSDDRGRTSAAGGRSSPPHPPAPEASDVGPPRVVDYACLANGQVHIRVKLFGQDFIGMLSAVSSTPAAFAHALDSEARNRAAAAAASSAQAPAAPEAAEGAHGRTAAAAAPVEAVGWRRGGDGPGFARPLAGGEPPAAAPIDKGGRSDAAAAELVASDWGASPRPSASLGAHPAVAPAPREAAVAAAVAAAQANNQLPLLAVLQNPLGMGRATALGASPSVAPGGSATYDESSSKLGKAMLDFREALSRAMSAERPAFPRSSLADAPPGTTQGMTAWGVQALRAAAASRGSVEPSAAQAAAREMASAFAAPAGRPSLGRPSAAGPRGEAPVGDALDAPGAEATPRADAAGRGWLGATKPASAPSSAAEPAAAPRGDVGASGAAPAGRAKPEAASHREELRRKKAAAFDAMELEGPEPGARCAMCGLAEHPQARVGHAHKYAGLAPGALPDFSRLPDGGRLGRGTPEGWHPVRNEQGKRGRLEGGDASANDDVGPLGPLRLVRATPVHGAWCHEQCLAWSPEVAEMLDSEDWRESVEATGRTTVAADVARAAGSALRRARLLPCTECRKKGATLGCKTKCNTSYHLTCARRNGSLLEVSPYIVACRKHLRQFLTEDEPESEPDGDSRSGSDDEGETVVVAPKGGARRAVRG